MNCIYNILGIVDIIRQILRQPALHAMRLAASRSSSSIGNFCLSFSAILNEFSHLPHHRSSQALVLV
jgi:hypothetical protein